MTARTKNTHSRLDDLKWARERLMSAMEEPDTTASVASCARQLRAVTEEIAALEAEAAPKKTSRVDELAKRRADRRKAAGG